LLGRSGRDSITAKASTQLDEDEVSHTMNRALLLASLSLFLTFCLAAESMGGPITYNIESYAALQNGYTMSGTITTDGTIGTLASADVTGWSFSVTGPTSYQLTSLTPTAGFFLDNLTATATSLTLAPPTAGQESLLGFEGGSFGSTITNLQYDRNPANPAEGGPATDSYSSFNGTSTPSGIAWKDVVDNPPGLQLGGSTWVIATVTASAVPEPSTLTLALLGMACLAVAQRTMRYSRDASSPQMSPKAR
jgi:PEP-CTERM motif